MIRLFPSSHQFASEGKRRTEERHDSQKSLIKRTYAGSSKIEILTFQRPGPGGTTSRTETIVRRPQCLGFREGDHTREQKIPTHMEYHRDRYGRHGSHPTWFKKSQMKKGGDTSKCQLYSRHRKDPGERKNSHGTGQMGPNQTGQQTDRKPR